MYVSIYNLDNLNSYEWIVMKLAVNDHHQIISLKYDFEGLSRACTSFKGLVCIASLY